MTVSTGVTVAVTSLLPLALTLEGCAHTTLSPLGCDAVCTLHSDTWRGRGVEGQCGQQKLGVSGVPLSKLESSLLSRKTHPNARTCFLKSLFGFVSRTCYSSWLLLNDEQMTFWFSILDGPSNVF